MLEQLPDEYVLSQTEAAAFSKVSIDTLRREVKRGVIPRIYFTQTRWGCKVGDLRKRQQALMPTAA